MSEQPYQHQHQHDINSRNDAVQQPTNNLTAAAAARLFCHRFSLFDWCLVLIGIIVYAAQMNIEPWNRSLELASTNPLINLPYKSEQVPTWLLLVLAILVPILVIGLVLTIQWKKPSARAEAYQAVLTLFIIVVSNILSTDAIKKIAGRPRPNFIAYAGASYLPNSTTIVYSASHSSVVDAYQSYPSGHASLSMAGLSFLGFYLYYKLHPVSYAFSSSGSLYRSSVSSASKLVSTGQEHQDQEHGHLLTIQPSPNNQLWKCIVCLLPGILSVWIGLTRIIDYWHNYDDVTLGWLVGLFWSTFFWRNHFVPYQAFWASADVKRARDASASFDDVAVGVGGHGSDMAQANILDLQIPVSQYSPERAPTLAGAPVQATTTVAVPDPDTQEMEHPQDQEQAPIQVQSRNGYIINQDQSAPQVHDWAVEPHVHGDEAV